MDKIVNIPNNKFDQDSIHLLKIFPQEVWASILDSMMQDQENTRLINTVNSSMFFRNLMLPKRVLFLFPKVWEILAIKCEDEDEEDPSYNLTTKPENDSGSVTDEDTNSDDFETVSQSSGSEIEQDLDDDRLKGILKLRLVCTMWNHGIGKFYHDLPNCYKIKHDMCPKEEMDSNYLDIYWQGGSGEYQTGEWARLWLSVDYMSRVDEFMEHFETTHYSNLETRRNPFQARMVTLEYSNNSKFPEYFTKITNLLEKYGQYLWHCRILTEDNFSSRGEYYSKLKHLLEFMPNLKTLEIQYQRPVPSDRRPVSLFDETIMEYIKNIPCSNREIRQMLREIESNPLPRLDKLQFLKVGRLPAPIFNQFIRKNSHISMLEVDRHKFHENYDIYNTRSLLPNLEQLSMEYFSVADFQKLNNSQLNWNLSKLYMDFINCSFIEWTRVFSVLESKFANTLTNLMLNLPKTSLGSEEKKIMKDCAFMRLNLPRVKRFKLVMSNYSCLDFILPMQNTLEYLDVTLNLNIDEWKDHQTLALAVVQGQVIQFLGYFGPKQSRETDSNIWTLFPNLNWVKVHSTFDTVTGRFCQYGNARRRHDCWVGCSREEWEDEMKSKEVPKE